MFSRPIQGCHVGGYACATAEFPFAMLDHVLGRLPRLAAKLAHDVYLVPFGVVFSLARCAAKFGLVRSRFPGLPAHDADYFPERAFGAPLQAGKPARLAAKNIFSTFYIYVRDVAWPATVQARNVCSSSHARRLNEPPQWGMMLASMTNPTKNFYVGGITSKFWEFCKWLNVVAVKLLRRATFLASALIFDPPFDDFARGVSLSSNLRSFIRRVMSTPRASALAGTKISIFNLACEAVAASITDKFAHLHRHAPVKHVHALCSSLNGGAIG